MTAAVLVAIALGAGVPALIAAWAVIRHEVAVYERRPAATSGKDGP